MIKFLAKEGFYKQMTDCKQCDKVVINVFGDTGCLLLRDWLTKEEYQDKKILDNCPKNKEQK